MPLPAGFKVNGVKAEHRGVPIPPRVQKIIALLNKLPTGDLLTSAELAEQLGYGNVGSVIVHPGNADYREKVDRKLFWGSRKSIAKLRKQLAEPEGANDQD